MAGIVSPNEFDILHPRNPHTGEFVDVIGTMEKIGATYVRGQNAWKVPKDRRPDLDKMLRDLGASAVDVPRGMHPATDEERKKLKIPPGWKDVFVSDRHDLVDEAIAVGRDEKGRAQHRYSDEHKAAVSARKYARVASFEQYIPSIDQALHDEALGDDTMAALMLMRKLGIRTGSTADTKAAKKAYGASTLLRKHVQVTGDRVRFEFPSKKGGFTKLEIEDPELAKVMKKRMTGKSGDERLFQTNGNKMARRLEQMAPGHLPYDFRTRLGTVSAMSIIGGMPVPTSEAEYKRAKNAVGDQVSNILGNTRKVALDSYINPTVFRAWDDKLRDIEEAK